MCGIYRFLYYEAWIPFGELIIEASLNHIWERGKTGDSYIFAAQHDQSRTSRRRESERATDREKWLIKKCYHIIAIGASFHL